MRTYPFPSAASQMPLTAVDWQKLARESFGQGFIGGLIGGTLQTVAEMLDEKLRASQVFVEEDEEAIEAAAILGVAVDATESEIRAALRARLSSSGLHPDHGGDGIEATRLIAAKNLLIQRRRTET